MTDNERLADSLDAMTARVRALEESFRALIGYVSSDKFTGTGDLAGYVSTADIRTRAFDAFHSADMAESAALYNAAGPEPADGGHSPQCAHGNTDRAGERTVNGYHCPRCGDALFDRDTYYRDLTPARAARKMRLHWIACHKGNLSTPTSEG